MKHLPNLLLVEGNDDRNVIRNLWLAHLTPDERFFWDTHYCNKRTWCIFCSQTQTEFELRYEGESGGVNELLNSLPDYLKKGRPPVLNCLGIVVDADADLAARWQEIQDRLQRAGYEPPAAPDPCGLVLEHPIDLRPRVGVWLMPDNQHTGKLEDFVRFLIPEGDPLAPKADAALDDIEANALQRYSSDDRSKAFIHTWLAWQEAPGRPMGQAITQKVLAIDSPQADLFIHWLQKLFCTKEQL